ncbi:acetyl-CoA C-acetyltransferase [Rickettsia prowazekii]|uniref:ACETYL-COA ACETYLTRANSFERASE (FadA) n=2 Tax=Rickettsia prowazekii TaxID=782 RepID=Q9ZCJ5_RICPR|nr:acetyl-CoA C-acetyltransferase [Rickettsia prowazekii]ADE30293.1 Acetyl-CoA acetyltransferase [Rickettsia prowazekii str. Rp22]AFE49533.1 acetyl-CoA acetyltransferase [Rickettsia prowazekii str. Chernikova]AFE50377.1 acetyl-CoA acetyltransferase [Rickettsia prowazekii str. Katsinyian]AFE51222.1 acetyl-CoA acetyltransferase [Rickettsia prowazekii str. BuV67-CWPP]AFE52059.1 acetyl-CoA acetyltransferase [Rickettsia prowazekii str. Dachau]
MTKQVYITHAKRTAFGSFMGSLSTIPAPMLAAYLIKDILQNSKIEPALVNEVILGQVITGGSGQNPARQTLIYADIPQEVPGYTINKVCGSGLKSIALAANSIITCDNEIVIAGGQENMSLGMHGSYIRAGSKFGDIKMVDLMQYDGLIDVFSGVFMGITAENIAKQFNISRQEQDAFALSSHKKAAKAQLSGILQDEILPIEVTVKKNTSLFDHDETVRHNTSIEILSKLRPAFDKNGVVTAGNSSSINDGAACVLLVSEKALKKHNLTPLARIVSWASAGVDPRIMGTAPVPASKKALSKAGWSVNDLEVIEVNEAFAAQSIYVNREMKWDIEKVNINGGAIAIGHPIGASGGRLLITLIHNLRRAKAKKGLVTLCIGGGIGISMCVEAV